MFRQTSGNHQKEKFMMILPTALLINNIGLFILETIGYHICFSSKRIDYFLIKYFKLSKIVVMLLDSYYHLCQAILCTVRIVSRLVSIRN